MSAAPLLLQRAVRYALDAVDQVTPEQLSRPTPCGKWDLHMLLSHTSASVAALQEGLVGGRVDLFPTAEQESLADPVVLLRGRLIRLLEEWDAADERAVAIADEQIPLALMAAAAALEIAVHGWDIYRASGHDRPIPAELAADLLVVSPQLVTNRHRLFAPPVRTPETAGPDEQLLAFLGRPPTDAASQTR